MLDKIKVHFTYTRIIASGFLGVILAGSILLCLPISSKSGTWTSFIDSLFTAASATCVTGLVVYDTFLHWSLFGQIVILILIQIGGLGLMTVVSLLFIFLKKNISIHERKLLKESAGNLGMSGIIILVKRIASVTFILEGLGAFVLAIRFCPRMGFTEGLYNAVFHSIAAFCNAGFDLMGKYGEFSSLTTYSDDIVVNITIMLLIVIGGIGFLVINDILKEKFNFKHYSLHTKIVLTATISLIIGGALLFYIFEHNNTLNGLSDKDKILAAFFQSVSPRTAGFNTVDIGSLTDSGNLLIQILMFIGGSPGSTAGGIKTTTFVVLISSAICASKNASHINLYKRRLEDNIARRACAIVVLYLSAVLISTLIICAVQDLAIKNVSFEVISAIATVGLTTGITPALETISKIILIIMMYGGRIGALSMGLAIAEKKNTAPVNRPVEKILM